MSFRMNTLTPATAIERLSANDPTLTTCDLRNSAVLQMKGPELIPKLAAAIERNTVCTELNLAGCNINDELCATLAKGLAKNRAIVNLDLQENKIGNEGAPSLANSLAGNPILMQINLFAQKGTKFGDASLHAFTSMFDTNVTLLKIVWRLDSRQSFRLTKMLTRNNDIDRRIKAGKDYADLLPEGVPPIPPAVVQQRASSGFATGTPRSSASDSDRTSSFESNAGAPLRTTSFALRNSSANKLSERSASDLSARSASFTPGATAAKPPAPPPAAPLAPPLAPPGGHSERVAQLAALDAEYEQELAALKARFAARRAAIIGPS